MSTVDNSEGFREQLSALINSNSAENGSDTPDFVLAAYLTDCLEAFDKATRARQGWYAPAQRRETAGHIQEAINSIDP